jgi:threonine dehydrogenase-like Zn-dependent dehydrogenase
MRALVLRDFYDIAVEERPDPVAGAGQVVVDVIATGICGSDFHGYSGENGRRHPGQVMGHETVGRVRELGSDVKGVATGQLVTVNVRRACLGRNTGAAGASCWASRRRSRRPSPTGSRSRPATLCRCQSTCPRSWVR